jgi:hypothetical protein
MTGLGGPAAMRNVADGPLAMFPDVVVPGGPFHPPMP